MITSTFPTFRGPCLDQRQQPQVQLRQDSHPYLYRHGAACLICEVDLGEVHSQGDDGGDCPCQGIVDHGKMPPGLWACIQTRGFTAAT